MSYLYIPDEDTLSIRFTDDDQWATARYFFHQDDGFAFSKATGEFVRIAKINKDLVKVGATIIVPEDERDDLDAEMEDPSDDVLDFLDKYIELADRKFGIEWDDRVTGMITV